MRNWCNLAVAGAVALGAVLAMGGAASAQEVPPSPPVFSPVDERGVDLASGKIVFDEGLTAVGPVGGGGLAHILNDAFGNRFSLRGTIAGTSDTTVVTFGRESHAFAASAGVYTAKPGSIGETLTSTADLSTFTFTAKDGTVATFGCNNGAGGSLSAICLVSTLVRPDGETLTYTYRADPGPFCASNCKLLNAITSNLGWMLKYDFVLDSSQISRLMKVTALNLAYEYCDPAAVSCTFTNAWPSVSYSRSIGFFATFTTTDSLGRTTTYKGFDGTLDVTTKPVSIVDASGVQTDIAYNAQNKVQTVSRGGQTWTYTYADVAGGNRQVTITAPGYSQSVVIDTLNQIISSTDGTGQTTTYTRDATTGLVTRVTAPEGNYVDYGYDVRGNVTTVTRVAKPSTGLPNFVTSYVYPATCTATTLKVCNKPTSITEAGATTTYTYDPNHGGVLTVTRPASPSGVQPQIRRTYAALNAVVLNPAGQYVPSATAVYRPITATSCGSLAPTGCAGTADETKVTNGWGPTANAPNNLQLASVTSLQGSTVLSLTQFTYTKAGDLESIDGPLAGGVDKSMRRYDTERQLLGEISVDPDGGGTGRPAVAQRYRHRANGQIDLVEVGSVTAQTDAAWAAFAADRRIEIGYDGAGRKSYESLIGGTTYAALTQYGYDAAGRPDCVAVRMNAATFGSPPASACTAAAPGAAGPDRITRYGYDNANRPTLVTAAYGTSAQRNEVVATYNPNGTTATLADGKGNITKFTYDGFDRRVKTSFPSAANGAVSSTTDFTQLTYDNTTWNVSQDRRRDGQTVTYTYDARHNRLSRSAPVLTSYTYDNFDRVVNATKSGQTLATTFDSQGRVTSVAGPLGTVSYLYDAAGRRTRMTWPDAFYVTYDYDYVGAVTAIRENGATSGAGVLATFGYDNLGRRTSLTRGNGVVTSYAFDPVSRLQVLTNTLPADTTKSQTLQFSLNPANEITNRTSNNAVYAWNGLMNATRSYAVNGLNQITSNAAQSLGYDARGSITSDGPTTYSYDVDNRLIGMSSGASMAYDPAGRLYQTTSSGGTVTKFAYDGVDLIGEYSSAGVVQRRYVHGPGIDEPLVWYEGSGVTDRRWLVADNQGSIVSVANGSGVTTAVYTYDEYGAPGSPSNPAGRFQYTGQAWIPEFGLYHYKARAYSPTLGRFMQADPIGYGDGMNLYAYVGDDPVNWADPSGLSRETPPAPEPTSVGEIVVIGRAGPVGTAPIIFTGPPVDAVGSTVTLNLGGVVVTGQLLPHGDVDGGRLILSYGYGFTGFLGVGGFSLGGEVGLAIPLNLNPRGIQVFGSVSTTGLAGAGAFVGAGPSVGLGVAPKALTTGASTVPVLQGGAGWVLGGEFAGQVGTMDGGLGDLSQGSSFAASGGPKGAYGIYAGGGVKQTWTLASPTALSTAIVNAVFGP